MNQEQKSNKLKITLIICAVIIIISGLTIYILLNSESLKLEDENFSLNDDRIGKTYFNSGFESEKIISNLDKTLEHSFTLNSTNYIFKAVYHLDYQKYKNAYEDLDISQEQSFFINDIIIDNLKNITWVSKFDNNYLIAAYYTSAYSTFYIINTQGIIIKEFINSASSSNSETEYPRIIYKDGVPTEIIYFSQHCLDTIRADDYALEVHIPYNNGTFQTETAIKNKNLVPSGMDICK